MSKTRTYAAVLAAVLALLVAGCGSSKDSNAGAPNTGSSSSSSDSASPSPSSSAGASDSAGASTSSATITIKNFKYAIAGTIAPGASVKVTNQDSEAHTVTADSAGGFDVKVDPGKTVMLKAPAKAGSYKFHCTYHSNMHGTLQVG